MDSEKQKRRRARKNADNGRRRARRAKARAASAAEERRRTPPTGNGLRAHQTALMAMQADAARAAVAIGRGTMIAAWTAAVFGGVAALAAVVQALAVAGR